MVGCSVQNCIASKSELVRRGVLNTSLDVCPFCYSVGESPSHLLFLCSVAWRVWSEIVSWWHFVWVSPPSLKDLLLWWNCHRFKNLEKLCWLVTFYSVVWSIWICRNDIVFDNKVWDVEQICDLIKTRRAMWIWGKYNISNYSVEDFKQNLDAVRLVKI